MKPILLPVLAGVLVVAAVPLQAQTVLSTVRPEVGLSVGDKMAARQGPVEFIVTMPDGKTTTAVAQPAAGGERAGTVHYPSDFGNAGTRVGSYSWVARIGGKQVLSGRFAYRAAEGGRVLFVPG